jgi:hypothetical protein
VPRGRSSSSVSSGFTSGREAQLAKESSMLIRRIAVIPVVILFVLPLCLAGCSGSGGGAGEEVVSDGPGVYRIDDDSVGHVEKLGNVWNLSVLSVDDNVFKAEYEAGFIQGHLQAPQILSARDNAWDSAFLTDQSPEFVKQIPPSSEEMAVVQAGLTENFNYVLEYATTTEDPELAQNMRRLVYRLIGIYHGTVLDAPAELTFSDTWLPTGDFFTEAEMTLGYEAPTMSFLDVYFLNGFYDLLDVLDHEHLPKCTAFVKVTEGDTYITHNSWMSFLDQSMSMSFYINGDFFTVNSGTPGILASLTDFGYNNKGLMFNETTHHATYTEPKTDALWMFFRAALAEQFAASMDEFYEYVSLEPSGTYMNGYMLVDTNTGQFGLVEMSYQSFVYFKSDGGGGFEITTKPEGLSQEYDHELVQSDAILGVNFPASMQIRGELKAVENRPARRTQLLAGLGGVVDIESAKDLIIYTDPDEPLSIYGRWDLGYGTATKLNKVPDGACDAKAASASMTSWVSGLQGVFDLESPYRGFWMKYGTATIAGKPFIWSESEWAGQKLRDVPNTVDGEFHLINTYIR